MMISDNPIQIIICSDKNWNLQLQILIFKVETKMAESESHHIAFKKAKAKNNNVGAMTCKILLIHFLFRKIIFRHRIACNTLMNCIVLVQKFQMATRLEFHRRKQKLKFVCCSLSSVSHRQSARVERIELCRVIRFFFGKL